jgi:hypothetical protein
VSFVGWAVPTNSPGIDRTVHGGHSPPYGSWPRVCLSASDNGISRIWDTSNLSDRAYRNFREEPKARRSMSALTADSTIAVTFCRLAALLC